MSLFGFNWASWVIYQTNEWCLFTWLPTTNFHLFTSYSNWSSFYRLFWWIKDSQTSSQKCKISCQLKSLLIRFAATPLCANKEWREENICWMSHIHISWDCFNKRTIFVRMSRLADTTVILIFVIIIWKSFEIWSLKSRQSAQTSYLDSKL